MERTLSLNNNIVRIETKTTNGEKMHTALNLIQNIANTFDYNNELHWLIFDSDTIPQYESSFFSSGYHNPITIGVKMDERNYLIQRFPEILKVITDTILSPLGATNNTKNYIKFVILHEFGHFLDYRRGLSLGNPPFGIEDFDNLYSYIIAYRNYPSERSADDFVKEAWRKIG
ncbi:MAG: hypothetical protein ACLFT6_07145, partial [Bacteroidales bacterium]